MILGAGKPEQPQWLRYGMGSGPERPQTSYSTAKSITATLSPKQTFNALCGAARHQVSGTKSCSPILCKTRNTAEVSPALATS
jgi:hypothetical protein